MHYFKKYFLKLRLILDIIFSPLIFLSGLLLKFIRKLGLQYFPLSKTILLNIGVFPIIKHYYEPQFDYRRQKRNVKKNRKLTGINWNINMQLKLLDNFKFANELSDIPIERKSEGQFYINNNFFGSGDAEYWYQLIRYKKPKNIFEIGSGFSTLLAIKAIEKNKDENPTHEYKHICIEPYEMPWLEKTNAKIIRKNVENIDVAFFTDLQENDILFIDSSHMIKPHGDVLYEYLELLPTLNKGVIVHLHDIFSPKNYPVNWLEEDFRFWNEQYILEAFLTNNSKWKIIGALNFLHHNYNEHLSKICPFLTKTREPGSFYIQKQ